MNADAHLNLEALNHAALKEAMGCFATGVTVVTTSFDGVDHAMTCNSFNTVSLDPAMVLWSIRKESHSHAAFTEGYGYTVSILGGDQRDLAMKFARGTLEQRFADVPVSRLSSGRLVLSGAVAWFDCAVEKVVEAGDHHVLIGRVLGFSSNGRKPLGYVRGEFVDLGNA
jgi:3-hydroxy-9,10-secoandrosta-1,3,5(10)-triene-9,17-dione monooxygenase reductase component